MNSTRLGSALILLATGAPPAAALQDWPTAGWPRSTPRAEGLDPGPLATLTAEIGAGKYGSVDRMFVVRNGKAVVDERWPRDYRAIGRGKRAVIGCGEGACAGFANPEGFNYFDPATHPYYRGRDVHTLQSVTKSIAATVIGVAIQQGVIAGIDQPLLSFLSDYDLSAVDPRLRRATLADLLTMRTGIEWHEQDRPLDSTNTTFQLEVSPDWVRFTLAQPIEADPGAKWVYNSGGSHLMSAVIRKATGATADRYAEQHLFRTLGIRDYHWKRGGGGLPDTEGGLYLAAEDLAKIGYLYLRGGEWDGRRVLPETWVKAAVARQVDRVNQAGFGYGYQWWRVDRGGVEVWAGLGFGGQYLLVIPAGRIVAVMNAWNVFGDQAAGALLPFVDALLGSARLGRRPPARGR